MLTDTTRGPTPALKFALRTVAWSLALFGLLRLSWTEAHLVLPLTRTQAGLAVDLFGAPALPIEVTLACSGADAVALCFGTVLAYPVSWLKRMAGAAGGAALILALNIARIGTLGYVAASPTWFTALHLYVWPAILTLAIAGYVFTWMRVADRRPSRLTTLPQADNAAAWQTPRVTRRFVVLTAVLLFVFLATSPFYLESAGVLAIAGFIARTAATILGSLGVSAYAIANVLWTPRGEFLVTQECISTPLIPIYLAAVGASSSTWQRLTLGVLAALPLFIALGIARLLVVALPDAVLASPLFLVHAFYQLLLAAVVVLIAALWRHGNRSAVSRTLAGFIVAVLFVQLLGPFYSRAVTFVTGAPLDDPQGAVAFLPAFQVGLYLALWIAAFMTAGWRRFVAGFALLEVTQVAGLLALQALARHPDLAVHVRDVRGWAVAGPLLVVAAVVHVAQPRR